MFGQGVTGSSKNVPQWILDITREVEEKHGFCTSGIYYKEAKQKDYYRGCYYVNKKIIDLYFSPEKNNEAIFVLLHELTHAWQHLECPCTLTKISKGKRKVNHNKEFFLFAKKLYERYGVLDIAIQREYKRGRKYIVK